MAKAYVARNPCAQTNEPLPIGAAPAQSPLVRPARPGRLAEVLSKLFAPIKLQVPLGYEDDAGFHYGAERFQDRAQI